MRRRRSDVPDDAIPQTDSPLTPREEHEGSSEYRRDPVERLQAYRLAMDLTLKARALVVRSRSDPGTSEIGPQLLRATASIAANIAEGYSRTSVADRRKFYEYALGSARECHVWLTAAGRDETEPEALVLISIRRLLLTMIRTAREVALEDRMRLGRG